jgi:hypothetical protein
MSILDIFINLKDMQNLNYAQQCRFSSEFFNKIFILIYIFKETFETR